ncbi:ribosomal protein l9 rnase h1 [Diplodia corticola]|uniref:Ribosomal protein l9 rnase h1 n=1 Tax=Diplodia corticola TaxID=236234 RepID=A0A1J9RIR0_9PEZI|nr:ribosomal protein l9 rnase h1 [Diplodia corticola]OJD39914.1 ribosomal protein l9 rnase h1 [Diplodia corticola]
MSAPLRPSLLPQCTSCARRFANAGLRAWAPFQQQARGAKKASKLPNTLIVRLLKDVKAYGRKGSFVPVLPGLMRNEWFPGNKADYVTPAQLRQLKAKDVSMERDHMFGLEVPEVAEQETGPEVLEIAMPKPIEVEGISPQRSMELIANFVPPRIDIERDIGEQPSQPKEEPKKQPRLRGMSAADVLAAASGVPEKPADTRVRFFGSVSTQDIVTAIKEQLDVNEEGSRVVVAQRDVRFLGGTEPNDETRIKYLGDYEFEVKVQGATDGITRKLRILPTQSRA